MSIKFLYEGRIKICLIVPCRAEFKTIFLTSGIWFQGERIEEMNDFTVKWIDKKGVERSKKYKTLNDATYARNWLLKNGAKQVEIFINK